MNIVFAIKALGNPGGGAERVLVDVASGLAGRGHTVTLISSDMEGQAPYYPLDRSVQRVNLGIGNVKGKSSASDVVRRMTAFRRVVVKIRPDVVVAFMHSTYIPAGISLIGTGIPMIASEHISPEHYQSRLLERSLLQLTPLIAAKITVVTRQILCSFGWWLRRHMVVAPNPVAMPARKRALDDNADPGRPKVLLNVGRFAPQKNQQCLVAAFAKVARNFPNWKLRIIGDGELRAALESQVGSLGLADRVELPGALSDVSREYGQADLFVLPSTYESFGLATAEALLHRLPAVGFADCPGTNSLIRHNENGVLVDGPDRSEALAIALSKLMGNPQEMRRLAGASTEWLESQFGIESVLDCWERLIQEVGLQRRKPS